jgi:hypothetical protein
MAWTRKRYRDVKPRGSFEQKPQPTSRSPRHRMSEPVSRYSRLREADRRRDNAAAMDEVARLSTDPDHIRLADAELAAAFRNARERLARRSEGLDWE